MKNRKQSRGRENSRRQEERERAQTAGTGERIRDAAGLALFTGACAGTGALIGAANFFYKCALAPKKYDESRDSDPTQRDYVEGRRWVNGHPLREDIYLRSDDGLQLHASFIPAGSSGTAGTEDADPAPEHRYAICLHGYGDSSESMGLYARVFRDRYGMQVLLPDLRGHGKSDGDYIGMGFHDSRDLLIWIDWVLERDPAAQIVLHGISMGAAAILITTGLTLPEQVAAAVSDASYTTAEEIFKFHYNRRNDAVVPAPVMMEAVRGIAMVRAGYDIAKASPLRAVAKSQTPTLFIHGQSDDIVPPAMMPPLYRAASCPKAFLWIPEAGHVQSVICDPEMYWARIERFLHANGVALG